ncbi:hypothetical protein F7731_02820 [Cytobacillus depressus]|uniref:Uncharacterized protein n=1 Tax=Cytobacillus depressus TaxID=1602942 RepID=A0A6L3VA67_9BACI|nr:hypothetical protein [Cytobacillus depressus]KAB2338510.1 hypothetical protein F7731_02820 [Cytobacillus depressus]
MRIYYAVEANTIIEEVPEFKALIFSETNIFDSYEGIFIFETKEAASQLEILLEEAGLLESQFELILAKDGIKGETFADFGFVTEHCTYLLHDLVCSFSIKGGDKISIEMANLQLHEHLIYESYLENKPIYFIERHLKDLVKGIANAYDIEVSFFELDKQSKKL